MAKIHTSVEELIGSTPLIELTHMEKSLGLRAKIYAKAERFNPAGSAKDRVAKAMIDKAEADGRLKAGGTVIEPTSGNTGIGLALIAALRGYRAIIVMPDSMSPERIKLMRAYGAEVVLTPGADGMTGAIRKAESLADEIDGAFIPDQFGNPANAEAHYMTTGPEIYADTDGVVDYFVSGVGTGGTLTGVGRYLKDQRPDIKIVAVEPADSPLLSEGKAGAHKLQGIGANFVPDVLDRSLIDEIITVTTDEAYEWGRTLAKAEGILAGITSGAALAAAVGIARRPEAEGKHIVVLLPDTGERYLSGDMFD